MDSKFTSDGTQPPPRTRRWSEPSNSGETKTGGDGPHTTMHPQKRDPSTRARSTTHGPCQSPRSGAESSPQLRVSSTSGRLTAPGRDTARRHDHPSPAASSHGGPRPHQHPQQTRGHLGPHQGCHTASHAPAAPPRGRTHWVPGTSPPQGRPAQISTDPGPGGEHIPRPLTTSRAPLPQDIGTVHAHPDLGVYGSIGAYECVGPGWQRNVLLTHVLFWEETKDFLDALSLAYRRLSLLAPAIIIGDLHAALTNDDRTGQPTATDIAV